VAEKWTIPVQNDATVAQLNSSDVDMVVTHSTNSMLQTIRTAIWPIAWVIVFVIVAFECRRLYQEKLAEEDDDAEDS
jgi:hypothetical protein